VGPLVKIIFLEIYKSGLRFEVMDMDGRRVDKVLVAPIEGDPK
jgi:CBS domain containing-hemolysin-like protein